MSDDDDDVVASFSAAPSVSGDLLPVVIERGYVSVEVV